MTTYLMTLIDLATGTRLDTFDDEMTEAQLDAHLANALEIATDRYGSPVYRYADGWYSYLSQDA